MRKDQRLFDQNKCPITFVPVQTDYINIPEEFRDITNQVVPGILPYYMISNYGRIWHKYKQTFLSVNIDTKGYLYKPLATVNGPKNCRIHRLVMMTFCYFDGCEDVLVDHIDMNKGNCYIWNLRWASYSENALNSVRKIDKLSEKTVRDICKLLEDSKITLQEVSDKTQVSYQTVQAIQQKRTYVNISSEYNISQRKINNNFSIDQVHKLCHYFESHKKDNKITLDEYSTLALIGIGVIEPTLLQIRSAKKIYTKETYKYVSIDYNF